MDILKIYVKCIFSEHPFWICSLNEFGRIQLLNLLIRPCSSPYICIRPGLQLVGTYDFDFGFRIFSVVVGHPSAALNDNSGRSDVDI